MLPAYEDLQEENRHAQQLQEYSLNYTFQELDKKITGANILAHVHYGAACCSEVVAGLLAHHFSVKSSDPSQTPTPNFLTQEMTPHYTCESIVALTCLSTVGLGLARLCNDCGKTQQEEASQWRRLLTRYREIHFMEAPRAQHMRQ